MAGSPDLIVRGGTVIDGSGGAPYQADVAVDGGKIVEIGRISAQGRREVDADGALVTPGFVDIHTHYDGQATWGSRLTPTSRPVGWTMTDRNGHASNSWTRSFLSPRRKGPGPVRAPI